MTASIIVPRSKRPKNALEIGIARIDSIVATGVDFSGRPLTPWRRAGVDEYREGYLTYLGPQIPTMKYYLPTETFERRLTIHRGSREIQLLNFGRGNTRGDAVMFLPQDSIVATGDLLVYPIPYPFGSYISDWIKTLASVEQLGAKHIIPGHGPVQHDYRYLDLVSECLSSVVDQTKQAVAEKRSVDETVKAMKVDAFKSQFARGSHALQDDFDQILAVVVQRAYQEATAQQLKP